jgi:hypothetical protein
MKRELAPAGARVPSLPGYLDSVGFLALTATQRNVGRTGRRPRR